MHRTQTDSPMQAKPGAPQWGIGGKAGGDRHGPWPGGVGSEHGEFCGGTRRPGCPLDGARMPVAELSTFRRYHPTIRNCSLILEHLREPNDDPQTRRVRARRAWSRLGAF